MMKKIILAYIPVIHAGYLEFFERHADADRIVVFGRYILKDFDHLVRKDIRAVKPEIIVCMIRGLNLFASVSILDPFLAGQILHEKPEIVMPDEDESHQVAEKYFGELSVSFDPAFLRWDKSRTLKEIPVVSEEITHDSFHQRFMGIASTEAKKSSDWWRQVGAVVVKSENVVLVAHNEHVPSPLCPYVFGDPRGLFSKGILIELTTAEHAEASVIAEAARHGISLHGAQLYVTTFPCPMCARLIAHSGIQTCYYRDGYGVLDGEDILRRAGVTLVRVVESPLDR